MSSLRFPLYLCLAASILCMGGCVRFHPQPLTAMKNLDDFEARTLDSPELRTFLEKHSAAVAEWPPPLWDFDKLALAAFYYNPDLDVARAKWGGARAGRITAGERPNPTVTFSPGYDTTTPPPWIFGVSFDIPIETAGKRGYRMSQAKNLSEAARLNIATAAWSVRSRVRKSLIALSATGERHTVLTQQQTIQSENVRLLEQQLEAGAASRFEVTQSRLALNTTRLALHDAAKQMAQARVDLAEAVGVPANVLDQARISVADLKQARAAIPLADVRRRALLNRSDILGALAEYAASEAALHLEIAKQYPDVHLSPGYQLDQADNKWSLGLTVTLPILNQNRGAIAEAEARRNEVAAHFNAVQSKAIADIDRAVQSYQAVLEKSATANALLQDQDRQTEASKQVFEAGNISRQELGVAQLELNTIKLAHLNVLVEVQEAFAALEDAVQAPLESSSLPFKSPETILEKPSHRK